VFDPATFGLVTLAKRPTAEQAAQLLREQRGEKLALCTDLGNEGYALGNGFSDVSHNGLLPQKRKLVARHSPEMARISPDERSHRNHARRQRPVAVESPMGKDN